MNDSAITASERRWKKWLGLFGPALAVYLFATLVTDAFFMADTADYVDSIAAFDDGADYKFWEFGHLLWRPLGWVAFYLAKPLAALFVDNDRRAGIALVLVAINWLAGLWCVLLLVSLLKHVTARRWLINLVVVSFIFAQGFLNFAQTGSSYIPGLAFLLLGLNLSMRSGERKETSWRLSLATGLALSLAVLFWFPYVWAVPGAIAAPLLLSGFDRRQIRFTIETAIAFALLTGVAYAAVLGALGIYSLAGLKAWIADSSHGNQVRGATRMVFGLARSFINMGNDGMLFKRFLVRDPFNAVSSWDLLKLSLWKLLLFYLFIASIVVGLWRMKNGWRALMMVALGCVPIILFAIFFDGGAVERYLPLYPFIFLGVALLLESERVWRPLKYMALAFIVVAVVVNTRALSKMASERQQAEAAARIEALLPVLKPKSVVYVANWQDDLMNFSRSFPFHPVNRHGPFEMDALVTPGTAQAAEWREDFAARVQRVWAAGGDVWVSRRVLTERPRPEWNWVEGDERNVSWSDFRRFFSELEEGESRGGEDGFMLVARTPKNEQVLGQLAEGINRSRAGR